MTITVEKDHRGLLHFVRRDTKGRILDMVREKDPASSNWYGKPEINMDEDYPSPTDT